MAIQDREDQLARVAQVALDRKAVEEMPHEEFAGVVIAAIESRIDELVQRGDADINKQVRREQDGRIYEVTSTQEAAEGGATRLSESVMEISADGEPVWHGRRFGRVVDTLADGTRTVISLKLHSRSDSQWPSAVEYGEYWRQRGESGINYRDGARAWTAFSELTTGAERSTMVRILRDAGARPNVGITASPSVARRA